MIGTAIIPGIPGTGNFGDARLHCLRIVCQSGLPAEAWAKAGCLPCKFEPSSPAEAKKKAPCLIGTVTRSAC